MTLYTKPNVFPAWAESAGSTDLLPPSAGFAQSGWLSSSTPPARQYFNFVLNYATTGVRYFMQNGIPEWDVAESYRVGAVVRASDQSLWQARVNNTNENPIASAGFWIPLPYITQASLTSQLGSYVQNSVLTTTLANYVTNSALTTTLAGYVTTASLTPTLSNYVTNSALTTVLASYVQQSALTAQLGTKANLSSPALTGTPTAPTAAPGTNTTQVATTAFIAAALAAATSASFGTSGFWKDPNTGFKVNWGVIPSVPGGSSGGPISFASPFTSACYGIVTGMNGGNVLLNITSYGLSSFNWQTYGSAATANVMWFAYGK